MLKEFVKEFTEEEVIKDFIKAENEYFSLSEEVKNMTERINKKFIYAGKLIGKEGKKFIPGSWFLQEISKKSNKKISVNKKGEWLFICGRDILEMSVIRKDDVSGKLVLILNEQDECIGYGEYIGKKVVVKNLFDIGDFLRREK